MIEYQGNPNVFFNSFLELDRRNMLSILAFDSKAIQYLLQDDFEPFFQQDFPLFYKNRPKLLETESEEDKFPNAIDKALKENQIRGVDKIIEHIIKF